MKPQSQEISPDPDIGFQQLLGALCKDVETAIQHVSVSPSDTFSHMCLLYVVRQLHHAQSLLALGAYPDGALILRSMLEGWCQLTWALEAPDARALRWQAYVGVTNWRLAKQRRAGGLTASDDELKGMEAALAEHADMFMSKKVLGRKAAGQDVPEDPYCENWTGLKVRDLFYATNAAVHHQWTYRILSDWHHWAPHTILRSVVVNGATFTYAPQLPGATAATFMSACQMVLEVAQIADGQLKLGVASLLTAHESA
ncbi:MAG: DUF5677 domain-containing protein, partial [Gemmatimonadota bacterium]